MLLVLEDLHWADGATLDVRGVRAAHPARGAAAGGGQLPGRRSGGAAGRAGWPRRGGGRRSSWLELSRFTRAELAAQLAGLRGGPVDGRVVAEVFDRSQGNPFFAEQLFAADTAPARPAAGVAAGGAAGAGAPAVTGAPSGCCRWRRWPAGGSAMTGWRPSPGDRDDELTDSLREAVDRGLLLVTPMEQAGQEVYEFRHALLQEAVYGELLPGQRARLHGAYGNALAGSRPAGGAGVRRGTGRALVSSPPACRGAGLVGACRQPRRAGVRTRGGGPALRTGAGAMGPGARCRRRAGTDRAGLHTKAARAWEYAGEETRALSHVEEAVRQVDPAADPVRACLLHNLRGWYDAGANDPEVVLAANREAVRLIRRNRHPPRAPRCCWATAVLCTFMAGRHEEAAAVHEQALAAARRACSSRHRPGDGFARLPAGDGGPGGRCCLAAGGLRVDRAVGRRCVGVVRAQTPGSP